MKSINPYLIFNGNCRDAMRFYEKCLGGTLNMMPFSEAPGNHPPEAKDRIMHANLVANGWVLMASDNMPGMAHKVGDNCFISIDCSTEGEVDKLFNALSDGGKVKMAVADTFWGARFGMCEDRFGVCWMFNFDKKK